jgi:hypothetical protein
MTEARSMSVEEENAAVGNLLVSYNKTKSHLAALQAEADKLAGRLVGLVVLLQNGPPYSTLPVTGFLDATRTEKLFKDLHDTSVKRTVMGQRLRNLE